MLAEAPRLNNFILNAVQDTVDFRDRMYTPTLVEVPMYVKLEDYQDIGVPVRSQGSEGSCTGFGLAAVANYLLRKREVEPDDVQVSPRMLYEMAKRYDKWLGEKYSGSSARGAMKGWHKHGVCADDVWKYRAGSRDNVLTHDRAEDARGRPLGAYFRVKHKDLTAMHAALAEVGVLYATARIHKGWRSPNTRTGVVSYRSDYENIGGHAFAIVAYDKSGFWVQNSWGKSWAKGGFGKISYDDWLENGMDVWVGRLGVPVEQRLESAAASRRAPGAGQAVSYSYAELRPHVVSLGNDGQLKPHGEYGTTKKDIETIFAQDIPRITQDWDKVRLLLYAHGGLVGESNFLQRVAEYRAGCLDHKVYPLAFVWHTDLWSTITNIIKDAAMQQRPEGVLEDALDFMLDRFDDTLEAIVRGLKVRGLWGEMKENARLATTTRSGGARFVLDQVAKLISDSSKTVEVHIAGHSAGSIFMAPLVQRFTSTLGQKIETCTLWAPAVTTEEFHENYTPAIKERGVKKFWLYTLTDEAEKDDHCANIYHKSLLYMVSNALEKRIEEPMLGMEKFVRQDKELTKLFKRSNATWVTAPNDYKRRNASKAKQHGDFDDDPATVTSTLQNILDSGNLKRKQDDVFNFKRSSSSLSDQRKGLT